MEKSSEDRTRWQETHGAWIEIVQSFVSETEAAAHRQALPLQAAAKNLLAQRTDVIQNVMALMRRDLELARTIETDGEVLKPFEDRASAPADVIERCLLGESSYTEYERYWKGLFV